MARYKKVATKMWDDEWFAELSPLAPSGQAMWVFLLTAPQTCSVPGLVKVGLLGMAETLGWSPEDTQRAFDELAKDGHAVADFKRRIVWVPNSIRYNMPENPNVVKGWRTHLEELPDCDVKSQIIADLEAALETLSNTYREAFAFATSKGIGNPSERVSVTLSKGFGKQSRKQEQEQEPYQEQEQEQDPTRAPAPVEEEAAPAAATEAKPPRKKPRGPIELDARQQDIRDAMARIRVAVVGWKTATGYLDDILAERADEIASVLGGDAYPHVPPVATLAAAGSWLVANPGKAKTPTGLPRYLTSWFAREEQRLAVSAPAPGQLLPPSPDGTTPKKTIHPAAATALVRLSRMRPEEIDSDALDEINAIISVGCEREIPPDWQDAIEGADLDKRSDGTYCRRPPAIDEATAKLIEEAKARLGIRAAEETPEEPPEVAEGGW